MCAAPLLQRILEKSCGFIHKKRLATFTALIRALIDCESLTMTKLGNALSVRNRVPERHSIKRTSNFLSNPHIQKENIKIQASLAQEILNHFEMARIIVDWTPAIDRRYYILRANLICKHSSIVIYQETYPEKKVNNATIQNAFLGRLHAIIPAHIKDVLIITDAGFQGEWFRQVEELDWFFCGRVRNNTQVLLDTMTDWEKAKTYAENATGHIKFLGKGLLAKSNKHEMYMYTYKQRLKSIKKRSQRNNPNACTELKRSIRSYTEGWFIVTNLKKVNKNTKKMVINHFKDRMKIEASNRLTKSTKFGFGLSNSMTKAINRIKILLLIEQTASLVAWLVGAYKEYTKADRVYSNGSSKQGRRLSLVKLGVRALKRAIKLSYKTLSEMLTQLASLEESLC